MDFEKSASKEIIDPKSVAIATITFYPDWKGSAHSKTSNEIRGNEALRTIREATNKGYFVTTVDGGSSEIWLNKAKSLGADIFRQLDLTASGARRQALKEASSSSSIKIVCWTEPEKVSLITSAFPEALLPIARMETDIIVPKRDEEALKTYPSYQVVIENRANKLWNNILRKHNLLSYNTEDLDVWFGPKFFRNNPRILSLFLARYEIEKPKAEYYKDIDPEDWANTVILPVAAGLKEGFRVKSVTVPYIHPKEQTKLEEGEETTFRKKRFLQFKSIISSTTNYIRMTENSNKSKLKLSAT